MDAQSAKQIALLHPKLRDEAHTAWSECQAAMPENTKIVITQSLRSFAQSDALYAQGRTTEGDIVTNAPAGASYHNYGLAFDFSMITKGKTDWVVGPNWMKVVEIMKSHGWTWGGDFKSLKDNPHFEKAFGHNWKDLLALHKAGKVIEGTDYPNI